MPFTKFQFEDITFTQSREKHQSSKQNVPLCWGHDGWQQPNWNATGVPLVDGCCNISRFLWDIKLNPHERSFPWWYHQMETFYALLAFVRGIHQQPVNSPHKGQRRGALMFFFICALNKQLSKQSWGWWFEMPSCSLWRYCNATNMWQMREHYGDVKWPLWHLELLVNQVFVQQFVQTDNKETWKVPIMFPL